MKATKWFTLLAGASLLLSASVYAGGNGKKLHLSDTVTVDGKQLAPGDYKFEWTGTGPDVKVEIIKGKDTVASVSAHVVNVAVANKQDGYSATSEKDGTHALTTIFFSGEKFDLEIGATSATAAQGTDSKGSN